MDAARSWIFGDAQKHKADPGAMVDLKAPAGAAAFTLTAAQLAEADAAFRACKAAGLSLTEAVRFAVRHASPPAGGVSVAQAIDQCTALDWQLRFALVKTSAIGGRAVVGGDLETAHGFVLLPLDHPVVKRGPLRVPGVKRRKLPRPGPPPRLGREPSQRARPSAPLVVVAVGIQAGKRRRPRRTMRGGMSFPPPHATRFVLWPRKG